MTTIVLGASGQVARHLRRLMPDSCFWGRASVDASNAILLEAKLLEARPTAIVNAAGFTAVDRAEADRDGAWRLNAEAPGAAARAAEQLGIALVHVSTDYVFDGRSESPYTAHDPVNPLNAYGRTKLAGELAVQALCSKFWILRASWVFSEYGRNFVKVMLDLAQRKESLEVVADQFGRPTFAGDLALAIHALIASNGHDVPLPGVYHAVGGPVMSWHGFAELIFQEALEIGLIQHEPIIHPIASSNYKSAATRPLNAVLDASLEISSLVASGFDYREGLRATLAQLAAAGSQR